MSKKDPKVNKTKEPHFSANYGYTIEEWAMKLEVDRMGIKMWEECGYENSWEDLT